MKKFVLFIFCLFLFGCSASDIGKPLRFEDVVNTFDRIGMSFQKEKSLPVNNIFILGINENKPYSYKLLEGVVHIFVFKSEKERTSSIQDFYQRPIELYLHKLYEVKNVAIFYIYGNSLDQRLDRQLNDVISFMKQHSFY